MRNQLLNVAWTVIGFIPLSLFWFDEKTGIAFYIFLLFSFAAGCLPERIYIQLHFSKDLKKYEALGVKSLKKFVQHGDFKRNGIRALNSYLQKLSMFERYHYICLVFMLASSIYACLNQHISFGLFIFLSNLFYNVYPILLQQYNRTRINRILVGHSKATYSKPNTGCG